MARFELSSTLKNLKFMQRATLRKEKTNKKDEVKPDTNFATTTRKCVVVMEGDPHPGALKGRMSFQNFNQKLNAEDATLDQPADEPETTISKNQCRNVSFRENSPSVESSDCSNLINGNAKRKHGEVFCEAVQHSNKSRKELPRE